MLNIELKMNGNDRGAFIIEEDSQRTAEMVFGLSGNQMTVFHTEVDDKYKGKGVSSELLAKMVAYARANKLQVNPRCAYVHAQFKRHPEQYADVWKPNAKD